MSLLEVIGSVRGSGSERVESNFSEFISQGLQIKKDPVGSFLLRRCFVYLFRERPAPISVVKIVGVAFFPAAFRMSWSLQ